MTGVLVLLAAACGGDDSGTAGDAPATTAGSEVAEATSGEDPGAPEATGEVEPEPEPEPEPVYEVAIDLLTEFAPSRLRNVRSIAPTQDRLLGEYTGSDGFFAIDALTGELTPPSPILAEGLWVTSAGVFSLETVTRCAFVRIDPATLFAVEPIFDLGLDFLNCPTKGRLPVREDIIRVANSERLFALNVLTGELQTMNFSEAIDRPVSTVGEPSVAVYDGFDGAVLIVVKDTLADGAEVVSVARVEADLTVSNSTVISEMPRERLGEVLVTLDEDDKRVTYTINRRSLELAEWTFIPPADRDPCTFPEQLDAGDGRLWVGRDSSTAGELAWSLCKDGELLASASVADVDEIEHAVVNDGVLYFIAAVAFEDRGDEPFRRVYRAVQLIDGAEARGAGQGSTEPVGSGSQDTESAADALGLEASLLTLEDLPAGFAPIAAMTPRSISLDSGVRQGLCPGASVLPFPNIAEEISVAFGNDSGSSITPEVFRLPDGGASEMLDYFRAEAFRCSGVDDREFVVQDNAGLGEDSLTLQITARFEALPGRTITRITEFWFARVGDDTVVFLNSFDDGSANLDPRQLLSVMVART